MKTTHTQGEWKVNAFWAVVDENDYGIAQIHGIVNEKNWEANAKLIAAAPDLLEALESVALDLFYQIESTHGEKTANKYPSITQAKKAIKKAKGE